MDNDFRESNPVVPRELAERTLSSNGHEKNRLEQTIARKLGRTLNRLTSQFSAVQQRTLLLALMLLLASYFVFVLSKGFQSPSDKMDNALNHSLPSAPTQSILKPGPVNQQRNQSTIPARVDSARH